MSRRDRTGAMKSEIIAPPHILLFHSGLAAEKGVGKDQKVGIFHGKKFDSTGFSALEENREREAFVISTE